jgi:4-alpha-glucanotransferase
VFRWEREWDLPGQPFRDPADYPAVSVGVSGTHDTEPQLSWWNEAPAADRALVSELPTIRGLTGGVALGGSDQLVRDTLLEALFASASDLVLLPVIDVFGWDARINDPRTLGGANWTFRLPWPCDRLDEEREAVERRERLSAWALKYGRSRAET